MRNVAMCALIAACDPTLVDGPTTNPPVPTVVPPTPPGTCAVDDDCVKVYSDCSYCNCEAVVLDQAWGRDDLGCADYTGLMCDYDCDTDPDLIAVCDQDQCALVEL